MRELRCLTVGVSLVALSLAVGCGAPKGKSSGRVPVHETTRAERKSSGMVISDLASASDQVAQSLIRDINRMVEEDFADPNVRAWVVFGNITNKSGTMPTSDFEMVRARIKDKLGQSRMWRNNIKYVRSRQQVEALNRREYGSGEEDLMQEGRPTRGVERPDPVHMYYLDGEAYGVFRGTTEFYYVTFSMFRASDGEEIFSQEYEVKYDKK